MRQITLTGAPLRLSLVDEHFKDDLVNFAGLIRLKAGHMASNSLTTTSSITAIPILPAHLSGGRSSSSRESARARMSWDIGKLSLPA